MMILPTAQSLPVKPRWQTHFPSSALKLPWPEQFGRHCNDEEDDDRDDDDGDDGDDDDHDVAEDSFDDEVSFYLFLIVIHLVAIGSTPSLPATNKY